MTGFTETAYNVFAPTDAGGNPRKVDNADTQRWGTEVERLIMALIAGQGGDIDLPNLLIRYTVTGGTANAITATPNLPVPSGPGLALFSIQIQQANTGPVTINGKPLRTNTGNNLSADGLAAGGMYLFLDNGDHFRLLSDEVSSAIVAAAEAAAVRAEDAAAGLNLPTIGAGDAGKTLIVKEDESGFELALPSITTPTRTSMKAIPALNAGQTVFLTEQGREGTFVLRSGTPPVTDTQEGIYVVSDTSGYYWERVYAPLRVPSVRAFGAALDGTTDDSGAIAGALAVVGEAFIPATAAGFVANNIDLKPNQTIRGSGKVYWKTGASASYAVRVLPFADNGGGAGKYATIEHIDFDLASSPTTTTAVRFGTGDGVVFGFRARDLVFRNCGEAVGDEEHASNYIVDVMFEDCLCIFTRGRQVRSRRSRGFITFRDFKIDHTYNTGAQVTWGGARFDDVIGLELEKFDVVGPTAGVTPATYQPTAVGLAIVGTTGGGKASVWLRRVLVDNTRGPAITIDNVFNVFSVDTCSYQNLGGPLLLTDVTEATFVNTSIAGGKGLDGNPGSVSGISLVRVTHSQFTNTQIKDCDGHGVVLQDSTDNEFNGLKVKNCTGRGYLETGTSDHNQVIGARYTGNTAGNLIQVGANSVHTEWIGAGGTSIQRTLGPITT